MMTKIITQNELQKILTPQQYACTQEDATEPPFNNKYWNHTEDGIYVDVVSGKPLFSSLDKYDSNSGWPSFTRPLNTEAIFQRKDQSHEMIRTEVRSRSSQSHLGHVFTDGPTPSGLRFCINSASLDFVPLEKLKEKGLGLYAFLFAHKKQWDLATLAGGCFWGLENLFESRKGVIATRVGYTGGSTPQANYHSVKTGQTGHAEAVQVLFDPKMTSFHDILLHYFKIHDPTTLNRQGNDIGTQYRSTIFYANSEQREEAEIVKNIVQESWQWGKDVVTEISPLGPFWIAEDEHQQYLSKHPQGYSCHFERPLNFFKKA
jgi:peptide methionine sulfoxide reductase msrA/msrB